MHKIIATTGITFLPLLNKPAIANIKPIIPNINDALFTIGINEVDKATIPRTSPAIAKPLVFFLLDN